MSMVGTLPARNQAVLSLLDAAKNHGDLAVKLSSLKQVKDILLSLNPSHAAEIFPYLIELQYSPEILVRKALIELIDEIGEKSLEHLALLLPILLIFLKDSYPTVAKLSIVTGTKIFSTVLEELAFQYQRHGIIERWLQALWTWMLKFRGAVLGIIFEAGPVGPKLLGVKFLETYIFHFTLDLDSNDSEAYVSEVTQKPRRAFNISWKLDGHPVLDIPALASDANRYFEMLLEVLQSTDNFPGSLVISAVNSLAAIARNRPVYYKSVLSALLDFNPNSEMARGRHIASLQYSLRTAFLGFLRCTHPVILESRERLLKMLRSMNAGDAADHVMRQMDKIMRHNERSSRDLQLNKDVQVLNQSNISGDVGKKRLAPMEDGDIINSFDGSSKKLRYGSNNNAATISDTKDDTVVEHVNGSSPQISTLDGDLTPVEQMIAMIGAFIAEGERGVESLEILVSNIHPDLLADIVITNMRHLPTNPFPLAKHVNVSLNHPGDYSNHPEVAVASNGFTPAATLEASGFTAQSLLSGTDVSDPPFPGIPTSANISTDAKRDPRRDPRRLDPRRPVVSLEMPPTSTVEDGAGRSDLDAYSSSSSLMVPSPASTTESIAFSLVPKIEAAYHSVEPSPTFEAHQSVLKDEIQDSKNKEFVPLRETNNGSCPSTSSIGRDEDTTMPVSIDAALLDQVYSPSSEETDHPLPGVSDYESSESNLLPSLPPYIGLSEDRQKTLWKEALSRIINLYQNLQRTDIMQIQTALAARLFGQSDVDDLVEVVEKHIVSDYKQLEGHELVMHILYHLYSLMLSDSKSSSSAAFEKFLLGVARSLLEQLPASDKSFSRLLGEAPQIPDSVLRMLSDICTDGHNGADGRDSDRVTQGLGALWSLILGRPGYRQACLDIVLKCAVHSKDDVRTKAIRLVSNKLYSISFLSESIEQYATNMFMSAIDQLASGTVLSVSEVESQEASASGSQVSEPETSQSTSIKSTKVVSSCQALDFISLFFALCAKKPILLHRVFDTYARAPKTVEQAVHRHIPLLIRTLASSSSAELLHIISDPPEGSEPLLVQVINVLCDGTTPAPDIVATVKHLYETKIKDAAVIVPIISAISRDEVLHIFPRLVLLPLDQFQVALAHILQGSAHTGPAMTPVEVLGAIHDISPERDGIPLKKITDVCSACFEQRTVFTHQVLAKALEHMVDRTPLPLLFMRTVIQAIDAYPNLVDFVMEILSKLVHRQIWRMPKLWVGFLKCISQTQPHSFRVLLLLPAAQLEGALNKYPNLRGPLTNFVKQSSVTTSLPQSTLVLLGLGSETQHMQQEHYPASSSSSSMRASEQATSFNGQTYTR